MLCCLVMGRSFNCMNNEDVLKDVQFDKQIYCRIDLKDKIVKDEFIKFSQNLLDPSFRDLKIFQMAIELRMTGSI